jgi:invasion protein IalB
LAGAVLVLASLPIAAVQAQQAPAAAPAAPAAAPAPAAEAPAAGGATQSGDVAQWLKVCNPQQPNICSITKDYVAETGPGALARFTIQTTPDPKKFAVAVLVPLGFVFPPGIPITIDGEKKATAQYVICLPESPQSQSVVCVAQVPVADDFIATLKKGSKLQIAMTAGDSKVITIDFSLAGFSKSFDGPDLGEAAVAKQREDAAKIFQQKAQERGQQLIEEQRKQKAAGGG